MFQSLNNLLNLAGFEIDAEGRTGGKD
jgi:hypothetical protein